MQMRHAFRKLENMRMTAKERTRFRNIATNGGSSSGSAYSSLLSYYWRIVTVFEATTSAVDRHLLKESQRHPRNMRGNLTAS